MISVGIAFIMLRKRKKHEARLSLLQRELIRKERLAAVGELAGSVAHEIRNRLAGIRGAIAMLARETPADDDAQEVMAEIQKQVQRMEHHRLRRCRVVPHEERRDREPLFLGAHHRVIRRALEAPGRIDHPREQSEIARGAVASRSRPERGSKQGRRRPL